MNQILLQLLSLHIGGNKSRIKCLSYMIISLITGSSIYQKGLSSAICGKAKISSKTHRIYRFFREFSFDYIKVTNLILSFFGQDSYIMAMDRTNWKFGKSDINILFLVIVIGKISVPISWQFLSHGGACSAEFMENFLQKFIDNFTVKKIEYLLADREFMSKKWLDFLIRNQIKFVIPLKSDNKIRLEKSVQNLLIKKQFKSLQTLEYRDCKGNLWGHKVNFAAYKNEKSELIVLVGSINIESDIFSLYRYRWSIERLFKHLKSAGFDLEKSQIIYMERFQKLLVVVAIAACLIVKNGLIQNSIVPIRIKKPNNISAKLFSIFTYGFDSIKSAFYQSTRSLNKLIQAILAPPNHSSFLSLTKNVG